jgi:thymidylate synthase (FAD)
MNKVHIEQEEYTVATESLIDPLGDGISSIQLIRVSGSDLDVVNAARVSYGKVSDTLNERDAKLINFLMEHDHTSPFEHNQLSFRVKAPLFVIRQWMRHRMNSYNEISYRYVKEPVEFYIPKTWRHQDKNNKQATIGAFEDQALVDAYKKSLEVAYKTYEDMLAAGVGREIARGILPLCTYSEFIFTCNLHSLMHFVRLRTHEGAQHEIRAYAVAMLAIAREHFPASIAAFERTLSDKHKIEPSAQPHAQAFAQLLQ